MSNENKLQSSGNMEPNSVNNNSGNAHTVVSNVNIEESRPERRSGVRQTIDEKVLKAIIAIDGALGDANIMTEFKKIGLGETKLQEGKALAEGVSSLQKDQRKEKAGKSDASEKFSALKFELDEKHHDRVKLAKVLFKNDIQKRTALGLDADRKRAFSAWNAQLALFYTNSLNDPSIIAELAKIGLTEEELKHTQQQLNELMQLKLNAESEKSGAVKATEERDTKLSELEDFMSELKVFAKVALKKRPDLLKKIGM